MLNTHAGRDTAETSAEAKRVAETRAVRDHRLETGVRTLAGWRRNLVAFAVGGISTLALAPLHLWPVMFATLPVLAWLLDGIVARAPTFAARLRSAAILGWCFGFGYFLASLYWIGFAFFVQADRFAWMSPLGILVMPAGLALFYALGLAMASAVWRPGPARLFFFALAFFAVELLRGHILTGFPWNAIGYTLAAPETLMQAGALVGVYGLSFFAVLVFAAPATLTDRTGRALRYLMPALAVLLLAGMAGWGWWRLAQPLPPDVAGPKLRIVQANIPQADKWKPEARDWIFQRYLRLSRGGVSLAGSGVTHVIWPEAALPFVYLFDDDIAKESQREAFDRLLPPEAMLITGANRAETVTNGAGERVVSDVYNSILAIDDRGAVITTADKSHLVPFGEYLPFQETLEAVGIRQLTNLPGGFAAGQGPRNLELAGLPLFTPLICYEIIFPGAVTPKNRPAWLLNVTDDSWFGETAGPYQHLHQARMRAVEEGLPVIRAANTGISAVIGPRGTLRKRLALGSMGAMDTALPAAVGEPLYARAGALIHWAIAIAGLSLALALQLLTPARGRRFGA
ncbi:apolipoprotein N-acyltransferase [Dichotomicrobium thermohalophilum]|uniref:Apolipoprotein N-acyltransferase n=1 Tax=Dichotomicrobium thermohalophilum TaxID=933063 RepID=A0A397PEA8_9HYPH|nr:apolipoprotein N-acyltransferase [Dichotomicrobium thermohalophilum]RIA47352.1 apolipoprotein N-acyltransferase [Dichotomicrobium thermohalophilum]